MINRAEYEQGEEFCFGYDSLVRKLTERLEVNPRAVAPVEGDTFDHEDMGSWVGAVQFKEEKVPTIGVNLFGGQGQARISFNTVDQDARLLGMDLKVLMREDPNPAIEAENKKTRLYAFALTEAKLRIISKIAEDTYPAVAFQIAEYRKEIARMREEGTETKERKLRRSVFSKTPERSSGGNVFLKTASSATVLSLILAACNLVATPTKETPETTPTKPVATETVTATPRVETATPFLKPTETKVPPTLTATATKEATKVVESKILLKETVEYAGRKFDFEITIPTIDKIMKEVFDSYKIESFSINEKVTKAREMIAKTLATYFLETYNVQNKKIVSLETFMAHPEKYPARIIVMSAEKKLVEQTITLDKIKAFEMRYVSGLGELYMDIPGKSIKSSGYAWENGKFILYSARPGFDNVNWGINNGLGETLDSLVWYGRDAVDAVLRNDLGFLPYTVARIVDKKGATDFASIDMFSIYDEIMKKVPKGLTRDEITKWMVANEVFMVTLK